MIYNVKLTLAVEAVEPLSSALGPRAVGNQQPVRLDAGIQLNFLAENNEAAIAVSTVLQKLVAAAEKLYGPVVLTEPTPTIPRLVDMPEKAQ